MTLDDLQHIAEVEYADIVASTARIGAKLRIVLTDASYLDVWLSQKLPNRFGFHWERQQVDGTVYRYDNFPDVAWQAVLTYPYHFHEGSRGNVVASPFRPDVGGGFRDFLDFARAKIQAP